MTSVPKLRLRLLQTDYDNEVVLRKNDASSLWFPLLTVTLWRTPTDTGGTQVPATFCASHADAAVTAKVSSGVRRVHSRQDELLINAYNMLVFQEKAKLPPELFNGSLPP